MNPAFEKSRPTVGLPEAYRGHEITVRFYGPDLICQVDGEDLPGFYLDAQAARFGGVTHIDGIEKAKAEKAKPEVRAR